MEGGIARGTQVGSYVIDGLLGRGGMGIVYRAYHPRLQRWAAIKMLPPLSDEGDARERFEREARAIAKLRNRHILSVFDFGEYVDQPFMAVELMPNGSLQERMPKEPISIAQAMTILRPVAEALDYAHAQGVLHRDVKPANIFLDADFQPVLADFGLAKVYSEESMTASGLVAGTPTHMSPEQANGKPMSGATDQYALAVIAFQLLTGRLPFNGQLMEVLYAHVNTPPPAASAVNPALNTLVDDVLARALAKDPQDRWDSCLHFVSALEAAGAGRVDQRAVVRPLPETTAAALATEPRAAPPPPRSLLGGRGGRRVPVIAGVAAAVVLALVAGAAFATGFVRLPGSAPVAAVSTPTPRALPTRRPTVSPTAAPTARPTATPTPVQHFLEVVPGSPLKRGTDIAVTGRGLVQTNTALAGVVQGGSVYPISASPLKFNPDGSFTGVGVVPTALKAGTAILVACPERTTDLNRCLTRPVEVA